MNDSERDVMAAEVASGRTDRVFDLVQAGTPVNLEIEGVTLLQHCTYYGDVSAIRFLQLNGAFLDLELIGPAFHGHWRLCQFLLEQGADVNQTSQDSEETALHAALCTTDRTAHDRVLEVLLQHGANPNAATKPGVETGGFMRDCRTKGETPLHRAAAFGDSGTIQILLKAGAKIDSRDMNGDTPLSWASWYVRPNSILRLLLYGDFRISPANRSMQANLIGDPTFQK